IAPLRVYAGGRAYRDPQDSSRWLYERATEPTVRIKRSRRPGFHSWPRTRAVPRDARPPSLLGRCTSLRHREETVYSDLVRFDLSWSYQTMRTQARLRRQIAFP